jgi:hypothetical protein
MKTVKASLRINKNGRLYCTLHQTHKVSVAPRNGCKICWMLFDNFSKQATIDNLVTEILDRAGH